MPETGNAGEKRSPAMQPLLELTGLTKRFGSILAVDRVGFAVARGEVVGFLGPNGAGKTTAMRMTAGFLPPDAGSARIAGFDIVDETRAAQARLGYLAEGAPSYGDMTPDALLGFVARVRGLDGATARRRRGEVVDRLSLARVLDQPIETLSKGFRRRVGLAAAILHDPEVLILDEPTDGLDPNQKHEVRTLLSEIAGGKAIVISTHILEEVDAVCTRAIVLAGGRIVADALPAELRQQAPNHNRVTVALDADHRDRLIAALRALPNIADIAEAHARDGRIRLTARPVRGAEILGAVRAAADSAEVPLDEITTEHGRLDDVFRRLTTAA